MFAIETISVATSILLIGDFFSTFLYHVPEHVFGKYHNIIHHGKNRSFIRYALLTKNPLVLISGFLGVLPFFIFLPLSWQISPLGSILGVLLGELHVIWRHSYPTEERQTPEKLALICHLFFITTPERHWLHHRDANLAYGDIFTFYNRPAQAWLRFLTAIAQNKRISKA